MTNKKNSNLQSPLFASALNLYRGAVGLAKMEVRVLNDRLRLHALRILEHVSTSEGAAPPIPRARSLRYAQLSLPKLRAVVEAAFSEQLISEEQRSRVQSQIRQLEAQIEASLSPASEAADTPSPVDERASPVEERSVRDELLELGRLAERNSSSHPQPDRLDDVELTWSG